MTHRDRHRLSCAEPCLPTSEALRPNSDPSLPNRCGAWLLFASASPSQFASPLRTLESIQPVQECVGRALSCAARRGSARLGAELRKEAWPLQVCRIRDANALSEIRRERRQQSLKDKRLQARL